TSLFSETFEAKRLEALASLVEDALHPDLERRPKSAAEGIERLESVFKASPQPSLPLGGEATPASTLLPADASPEQAVADLALSARAHWSLRKKGVSLVGQLVGLPPRAFEGMPNVGNKTRAELERLVDEAKARFPDHTGATSVPKPVRRPQVVLFPDLVGDERPVDELGRALTPKIVQGLTRLGVSSLGELAALDSATLRNIPGVGPKRLGEIIEAFERIAGTVRPPADLAELDHALEAELGSAVFGILSQLLGLADGKVRSRREVSDALGITRQRVEQVADVSDLRKRASVASALVDAVQRLLPPAGFARLDDVADTLQAQLPEVEGASALGHARLAAVLLEPERRLLDLERIELICRPPWTPESVKRIVQAVSEKTSWPPIPLHEAADLAWEAVPDEVKGGLRRWGVDARALLAALRPLMSDVLIVQDALFTPPVPFEDALAHQRRNLDLPISLSALEAQLQRLYQAVTPPKDRDEALAVHDLALHEGMVRDVAAPPPKPPVIPQVDEGVAHRVRTEDGTLDMRVLVAAAARGGFRVAMLPPGKHHRMVEDLRQALAKELGDDCVHLLDVDRIILETLEHAGLWADAEFFEKKQSDQWGWARPTLMKALEHELGQHAKAGVVTILGRPTLLGPLGLLDWLSGFYDDVRGGQQGLFVLALPGGIHDGRVRLNEKYPFPYTPDMAAVSLLPPAGFRLEPSRDR
ncbi:MAG: DNA-directed RNA polymerase subunit alpha C-terminal domain-containing protein, partial [Myxococcota bacterium]